MQTGLAPEAFVEKLVREQLPTVSPNDELDKKLRRWQKQGGTQLMPSRSAAEMFRRELTRLEEYKTMRGF
jgi:hypothetical protein